MNKSYFRFAILMLFFPVTGLVHAQETCSLGGNAGSVWGSLQELVADKFSDMDSLSHAQNATNSCFDATDCDPFSIGKCLEVLDCVGQGIPTEELSDERIKDVKSVFAVSRWLVALATPKSMTLGTGRVSWKVTITLAGLISRWMIPLW